MKYLLHIVKQVLICLSCLGECCSAVKLQEHFGIQNFFSPVVTFHLLSLSFPTVFVFVICSLPLLIKVCFFSPRSLTVFHPAFLCLFPGLMSSLCSPWQFVLLFCITVWFGDKIKPNTAITVVKKCNQYNDINNTSKKWDWTCYVQECRELHTLK